ncbi:MAG: diaminopimelate decarboxylase [Sandaracinaceae bacterium]
MGLVRGKRADVPFSPHFRYEDGTLTCDGVSLDAIAARFGTPTYVYSAYSIDSDYDSLAMRLPAGTLVAYAIKANSNLAILSRLAARGCGADIVSGGELERCLRAGIAPDKIVFSGVGKTDAELERALVADIRAIHVESESEIDALEGVARRLRRRARITLRVNPDVDPKTHPYIATGLHDTKFGLELDVARALLPRILASQHLLLEGVACHIGSQLAEPTPMADATEILGRFAVECVERGARLTSFDPGGGWPIHYGDEDVELAAWGDYCDAISLGLERSGADRLGLALIVEPGRGLVGSAGALLTRVVHTKRQGKKRFLIVDAAMTELIRPALYDAYHAVMPIREGAPLVRADLVGPVCESGDFFAVDRELPDLSRGELLLLREAGAYGASMGSTYNSRPLAAEVMVERGEARLIRRRQTIDELLALERID